MAKMYPEKYIAENRKKRAEQEVFEYFRDYAPSNWYVIHSFDLPNSPVVEEGEVDFIVIVPDDDVSGVYALEIKGGTVELLENGWWLFGGVDTKQRGPFQQAKEEMFAVCSFLKKKNKNFDYHKMFYGWGVVFWDEYRFNATLPEPWRLCKPPRRDAKVDLVDFIKKLHEHLKQKRLNMVKKKRLEKDDEYIGFLKYEGESVSNIDTNNYRMPYGPTEKEAKEIYGCFAQYTRYTEPLFKPVGEIEKDIIRFTNEQYSCLKSIYSNPRVVVTGGAGTGKTLLAIREARYFADQGKKVGLFCYNKYLYESISRTLAGCENISVNRFLQYLSKKIGQGWREDAQKGYFSTELPQRALECINGPEFDVIIVDEFQDLCTEMYLKVFDKLIPKGLSEGPYTFYGDFENQLIFGDGVDLSLLNRYWEPTRQYLTINCRNTKQIGKTTEYLSESTPPDDYKAEGNEPEFIVWTSPADQAKKLIAQITKNYSSQVGPIIVLSSYSRENSVVSKADALGTMIKDWSLEPPKGTKALFSTIQSFKGLDAPIVILTDITEYDHQSMMYVGTSRAKSRLIILESENAEKQRKVLEAEYNTKHPKKEAQ